MTLILYLQSNDSIAYSTIKFGTSIDLVSKYIRYRITSLSTIASFTILDEDDYITISGTKVTLTTSSYGLLPTIPDLTVTKQSDGRVLFTSSTSFTIDDASHRVKLLFGLYDTTLPTSPTTSLTSNSVSYSYYGNVLYLTTRTDAVAGTNMFDNETYKSIAYKSIEMLYPNVPVCSKTLGNWIMTTTDELKQLEFHLVDFRLHDISLHAPLYLTVECQALIAQQSDGDMMVIQ